jgi:methyl-accepting chemotaxis protein
VTINKKIIGLILLSFLFVSSVFTINSIRALQTSHTDNLKLFKDEFLELSRESFEKNSTLFFSNLDSEVNFKNDSQTVFDFVKRIDPTNNNLVVVDINNHNFLDNYSNNDLTNIFEQQTMKSLINKYLQENILNQKTEFDLDNFSEFSSDISNTIVPKKIHFKIYNNTGLMVGMGENFSSVKIRIGFIERQNQLRFKNQLYSSIIIVLLTLLLTVILLIILLRNIVLTPLKKVVAVVKVITAGDLTQQVKIKSNDEIGQLSVAFNEMTSKLKESKEILESKITERTKELQDERGSLEKKVNERTAELEKLKSTLEKTIDERTKNLNSKVFELERMNELMVGRELKMVELKKENEKLKIKK